MNDIRRWFVFLPVIGILSLALYGVGSVARQNSITSSCQSNLKQIGLGLKQYERDYDEKTVLAINWKSAVHPYIKNSAIFQCPGANGYALNRFLSGVSDAQLKNRKGTPTVFDSTSAQLNASDFGTSWPKDGTHWIRKRGRGTNVLFFDGHVEWMQKKPVFVVIEPLPTPLSPIYRFLKPTPMPKKIPPNAPFF